MILPLPESFFVVSFVAPIYNTVLVLSKESKHLNKKNNTKRVLLVAVSRHPANGLVRNDVLNKSQQNFPGEQQDPKDIDSCEDT
jgi:hypothetical protein